MTASAISTSAELKLVAELVSPLPLVQLNRSGAGDHRSEAGQGHQFHRRVVHGEQQTHLTQNQAALDVQVVSRRPICPQSIFSDALLWYGNQLGAIPGGGSSFWASG